MTCRITGAVLGAALLAAPMLAPWCLAKPPELGQGPGAQRAPALPERPADAPEEGIWVDLATGDVPAPASGTGWGWTGSPGCAAPGALSALFVSHPIIVFAPLVPDEATCPGQPAGTPDRHVRGLSDAQVGADVLGNLENLSAAAWGLEAAHDLLGAGELVTGMACLDAVAALCPGSSYGDRVSEVRGAVLAGVYSPHVEQAATEEEQEPAVGEDDAAGAKPAAFDVCLTTRVKLDYVGAPLQAVLGDLRGSQCVPVTIDTAGLRAAGIRADTPVTIKADNIPLSHALDVICRQAGLTYKVAGDGLVVSAARPGALPAGGEEASEEGSGLVEGPCPRAEALHARVVAARRAQVDSLLKACRLAHAEGRSEKARDLARQALALDRDAGAGTEILRLARKDATRSATISSVPPVADPLCPRFPPVDPGVVRALDRLTPGNGGAEVEVVTGDTPCPQPPSLAEQASQWAELLAHGQGMLMVGLTLNGVQVQVRPAGGGKTLNALLGSHGFAVWTSGDEPVQVQDPR